MADEPTVPVVPSVSVVPSILPVQPASPGQESFDMKKAVAAIDKLKMSHTFVTLRADQPKLKGVIPTGHTAFDIASGIGGIPRGVITEMYGAEGVGKSTLGLLVSARAQQLSMPVLWIDQEHSFDPQYAAKFGVQMDEKKLWLCCPTCIEDAFNIMGSALDAGFRGVVVYDSLGAGLPKSVMEEGAMGEMRPGLKSAVISVCIEQTYPQISANECTVLFINQLRSNIQIRNPWSGQQRVDNADMDQDAINTPGGRTLRHFAHMRIQLRKLHARQWEEREKKSEIEACFVKNKCAVPYGKCTMTLQFGCGFTPS